MISVAPHSLLDSPSVLVVLSVPPALAAVAPHGTAVELEGPAVVAPAAPGSTPVVSNPMPVPVSIVVPMSEHTSASVTLSVFVTMSSERATAPAAPALPAVPAAPAVLVHAARPTPCSTGSPSTALEAPAAPKDIGRAEGEGVGAG